MKNFKDYAAYYDLLYGDKDYQKEAEYIQSLLSENGIKNTSKLLDLGCGTGKYEEVLAGLGYGIHGVDLSNEMVEQAAKKLSHIPGIRFYQGDIREWNNPEGQRYDAVLALFHVISYQTSNEDVQNTFNSVHNNLKSSGLFIFDVWYGPGVLLDLPAVRVKKVNTPDVQLIRISEPDLHLERNLVDVNFTMLAFEGDVAKGRPFKEKHSMRYFFMPELIDFGTKCGFTFVQAYKSFTRESRLDNSWNIHCIFRRNAD